MHLETALELRQLLAHDVYGCSARDSLLANEDAALAAVWRIATACATPAEVRCCLFEALAVCASLAEHTLAKEPLFPA